MSAITFIHPNEQQERVDARDGESAMLAATRHGLDGIVAECGGNALCATCHVYVDGPSLTRLPSLRDEEDALLDGGAAEPPRKRRLSRPLHFTMTLDGLGLRIAVPRN